MEKKDSFLFPNKWFEPLRTLPDETLAEVIKALMNYWETGETGELSPLASISLAYMRGDIDAMQNHAETIAKKRSEAGQKSGRERAAKSKREQTRTNANKTEQTRTNANKREQNEHKIREDNIREDNIREDKIREGGECVAPAPAREGQEFDDFIGWIEENAPYIADNLILPTEDEFEYLRRTYGSDVVADTILRIENRTDLREKYENLHRTIITWLEDGRKN